MIEFKSSWKIFPRIKNLKPRFLQKKKIETLLKYLIFPLFELTVRLYSANFGRNRRKFRHSAIRA